MNISESYKKRIQNLAGIFEVQSTQIKKQDLINIKLYHGTNVERWEHGFMNYLFVTGDINFAKQQAMDWLNNEEKYTPIVVEIDASHIIDMTWEADDDNGRYPFKTWEESWKEIGCFVIVGNLDIDKFPIVWKYDKFI